MVERGPLHRKVLGAGFNGTVRTLTGLSRTTPRWVRAAADESASACDEQLCPGFAFDVELLMRADREGVRIAEVPVLYLHDPRSRVRVTSASVRCSATSPGSPTGLRVRTRRAAPAAV